MTDDHDIDPIETREWLDAVVGVFDRAVRVARKNGADVPFGAITAYLNTMPIDQQTAHPGVRRGRGGR